MKGLSAIFLIAFCLSPNTSQGADLREEEGNPKKFKNAEKVLKVISKFGLGGESVKEVAYFIDERMDDGNFRIHKTQFGSINMQFQYDTGHLKTESFQMKLKDDDLPSWEVNTNPRALMVNYHYEW